MKGLISIIVPVFNEEEIIQNTINQINELASGWEHNYEVIYVNDGSTDKTWSILEKAAIGDSKIKVISFSRNFGHQMAYTAGIDHSKGDAAIVIDGDLQDPPEVMTEFIRKWEEGFQVVYGKRKERKGETFFKLITADLFYLLLDKVSDTKIPRDVGDFRLMDRVVIDRIKNMRERHRFIRGMVSWVGYKQAAVEYNRDERIAGETKYPFRKMLGFALDGIFSFSIIPLKISIWLGLIVSTLAFAGIVYAFILRLFTENWVTGWTAIIISVLFIGGVQLISIGILGQYLGRTFEEIKGRPLYIVDKTINVE